MTVSRKTTILVSLLLGAVAPSACTITSTSSGDSSTTLDAGAADSGPPLAPINGLLSSFTGGSPGTYLGESIASSGDGNTLVAGSVLDQTVEDGNGSTYAFLKSSGAWATSGVAIAPTGAPNGFGFAVSASTDGSIVAVSAVGASASYVYVFSKSGAAWTQIAALGPKNASTGFGSALALSGDGKTLAVGADGEGDLYIYSANGSTWSQSAQFMSNEKTAHFGDALSISNDGATLAVGAVGGGTSESQGEACIFSNSGGTWVEDAVLNQSDYKGVALSGDGATVAAVNDSLTVDIFSSANNWAKVTTLSASGGGGGTISGQSVAISNDGRRVVLGAPHGNSGGAFVFDLGYATWSQTGAFTSPSGSVNGGDLFGLSVAISGDGSTVEVGSPDELDQKGAIYIFQ